MKLRFGWTLVVVLILVGSPEAPAQLCSGPDGLQGPCWAKQPASLPTFVGFQLQGTGICWGRCDPTQTTVFITMDALTQPRCGVFFAPVTVTDAGGNQILSGTARLDYTRTWEETDGNGRSKQVWRLLTKIDLNLGTNPMSTCPTPSCLFSEPSAFFYGYTDFAFDCSRQTFESAMVLFHPCDKFIHDPRHSSRPGAYHPEESFALVAPDNGTTPFVAASSLDGMTPFSGLGAGAVRNVPQMPGDCIAEEPVPAAPLGLIGQACACPLDRARNGSAAQLFSGGGSCVDSGGRPSSFAALNTFAPPVRLPWLYMITRNIGHWTGLKTGPYPGPEEAFVNEGFFRYYDSCTSTPVIELSYGALTQGGFSVVPDNDRPWQLSDRFLDLASNFSKAKGIRPPFTGQVLETRHLYYVNVP